MPRAPRMAAGRGPVHGWRGPVVGLVSACLALGGCSTALECTTVGGGSWVGVVVPHDDVDRLQRLSVELCQDGRCRTAEFLDSGTKKTPTRVFGRGGLVTGDTVHLDLSRFGDGWQGDSVGAPSPWWVTTAAAGRC